MSDTLDELRAACSAPLDHPGVEEFSALAHQTLAWAIDHLNTLPDQTVGRMASRATMEALLRESAPEEGRPFDRVLSDFATKVVAYSYHPQHPRFLAFIPTGPSYFSFLGDILCASTNFFTGVWKEAPGPAQVELIVLDWFKEWLGYAAEASGVLTGGGSEANLVALVAAREVLAMEDRARAVLYVNEQRHWSVDRAARIMGLRPDQVTPVEVDAEYRLVPEALRHQIEKDRGRGLLPWAAVANAGSTNTGAIDPLDRVSEVCQQEKVWLHVDAAYGWTAVLTEEGKRELTGIERADSLTLDPHKWFAQTYEAGCVLVRQGELLTRAFFMRPEYLQDVEPDVDEVNFSDRGIALTRRFRALKIWMSVQALGLGWFRRLVEHGRRLAELSQRLLEEAGCFEIMSPCRLSIVCFRHRPPCEMDEKRLDRWNQGLVEALRTTGRVFLSSTRLQGRVALRFCFVNWRTTTADVEEIVGLLSCTAASRLASDEP